MGEFVLAEMFRPVGVFSRSLRRATPRSVFVVIVGITIASAVQLGQPATADTDADCDGQGFCIPTNSMHTWCFTSSVVGSQYENLRQSLRGAMQRLGQDTNMGQSQIPNDECTWAADVTFHRENLGVYVYGEYDCKQNPNPPTVCSAAAVRANPTAMAACQLDPTCGSSDGVIESGEMDYFRDVNSCHEVGHSVGLQHHQRGSTFFANQGNDCMVSGWLENTEHQSYLRYNPHHIGQDHVNGHFP